MLKNIIQIVRIMTGCAAVIASSYSYAGVIHIPLELSCGKNFTMAPKIAFDGQPGVQYTLTTQGLKEYGKNEIMEVVKVDGIEVTHDGLYVFVGAKCIPSDNETIMSLTDSALTCKIGEGITVSMLEPNDTNPDKYHYVFILTVTTYDMQEFSITNALSALKIEGKI